MIFLFGTNLVGYEEGGYTRHPGNTHTIVFCRLGIRLVKFDEITEFNWNQSSMTKVY